MSFSAITILYILLDLFTNTLAVCKDVEGWLDSSGKIIQLIDLISLSGPFSSFEAFCESLSCWRAKTGSR